MFFEEWIGEREGGKFCFFNFLIFGNVEIV